MLQERNLLPKENHKNQQRENSIITVMLQEIFQLCFTWFLHQLMLVSCESMLYGNFTKKQRNKITIFTSYNNNNCLKSL